MLTTLLDPATLFALFDAPGLAVQATIEQGGWSGMLWPGHPDRGETATLRPDDVRAGAQLLSLALHYFTSRHPDADALQTCTATQGLCRYTVTFLSGYPVEEEAIYAHADAWLLALAGGTPPTPGGCMALTPPYDEAGHPVLPGGDIAAFTRAMVPIIEASSSPVRRSPTTWPRRSCARQGTPRSSAPPTFFRSACLGASWI
jgi:hypothetical protein